MDLFVTPILSKAIREAGSIGFLPIEFPHSRFGLIFQSAKNPIEVEGLNNTFAWKEKEEIDIDVIAEISDEKVIMIEPSYHEENNNQGKSLYTFSSG